MKDGAKFQKREAELAVMLALARYLVGSDDLHFGFWDNGLAVKLFNLPRAQERYSEFVLDHIPSGVQTVLDVGCGAGRMAARLVARGYRVEGVTPSPLLAGETRKLLGDGFRVHECRFEELSVEEQYDVVYFGESFTYMQTEAALEKSVRCIREGGYLVICDFFRTEALGDSPLNGGPRLTRFRELAAAQPLELCEDIDITKETAPTLDLADELITNVASPTWQILMEGLQAKRPAISWIGRRLMGKKIERFEKRYLRGAWSGSNFERYKSYRLMVFRRTDNPPR